MKPPRTTCRSITLLLLASLLGGGCAVPSPEGGARMVRQRTFGPFFESAETTDGDRLLAIRPVYSRTETGDGRRREHEWAWPLASFRVHDDQTNWRVVGWFGHDADHHDPTSKARVWIFPFWFHGVNAAGESYRALFPIAGRVDDFLGMDRFEFVLFPLWLRHQVKDIRSWGVLWPVFSGTHGAARDIRRMGVFPFYGYSRRGEEWSRTYVLWPFWSHARFEHFDPGRAWMLFPLCGRIRTSQQTGWYVFPPFFSGIRREDGDRRLHLPWPLIQIQDGSAYKRMIWPFWGIQRNGPRDSMFIAWPFWRSDTLSLGESTQKRQRLLPFWEDVRLLSADTESPDRATPPVPVARYRQVWPLYSSRYQGDDRFFRTLDLWPGRNRAGADRNWAPFWTVFQRRRDAEGVAVDAAWGLLRYRRAPDDSQALHIAGSLVRWASGQTVHEWRVLGGLLGRRHDDAGVRWRLGYLFRWSSDRHSDDNPDPDPDPDPAHVAPQEPQP